MLIEMAIAQELDRLKDAAAKREYLKTNKYFHKFDRDRKCEFCGLSEKEYYFTESKTLCGGYKCLV